MNKTMDNGVKISEQRKAKGKRENSSRIFSKKLLIGVGDRSDLLKSMLNFPKGWIALISGVYGGLKNVALAFERTENVRFRARTK